MLLKILDSTTILPMVAIVVATLTSPTFAMQQDVLDLPPECAIPIIRYISIDRVKTRDRSGTIVPDFKVLCMFRSLSRFWKEAADDVILKDQLLSITLTPSTYPREGLDGIAPYATTLYLRGWDYTSSKELERALSKDYFYNTLMFSTCWNFDSQCDFQEIGEDGAIALTSGLKNSPRLEELRISFAISPKSAKALGESLPFLPNLCDIEIRDHSGKSSLCEDSLIEIAKGLKHKNLKTLMLGVAG